MVLRHSKPSFPPTMMLGRLARSFAAPAIRSNAALLTQKAPNMVARRHAGGMPATLSFRFDGLMAQCAVAAIIHFVPQDIIFLGAALWMGHAAATASSPKKIVGDKD